MILRNPIDYILYMICYSIKVTKHGGINSEKLNQTSGMKPLTATYILTAELLLDLPLIAELLLDLLLDVEQPLPDLLL